MPFDGSNFKRLVRQISQGEYYEPKKPSSNLFNICFFYCLSLIVDQYFLGASPLISSMMTVNPNTRADIHTICSHQWLNEGYSDEQQCLRTAEEMASSAPVRLDLLLSLAPVSQETNNNLAVSSAKNNSVNEVRSESGPVRSQSLGSISPSRAGPVIPDSPGKLN